MFSCLVIGELVGFAVSGLLVGLPALMAVETVRGAFGALLVVEVDQRSLGVILDTGDQLFDTVQFAPHLAPVLPGGEPFARPLLQFIDFLHEIDYLPEGLGLLVLLLRGLLSSVLDLVGFLRDIGDSVLQGLVEGEVEPAERALLCDGQQLLLADLLRRPLPADYLLLQRAEAKHMKNETL